MKLTILHVEAMDSTTDSAVKYVVQPDHFPDMMIAAAEVAIVIPMSTVFFGVLLSPTLTDVDPTATP